jgi:hypothetical protein
MFGVTSGTACCFLKLGKKWRAKKAPGTTGDVNSEKDYFQHLDNVKLSESLDILCWGTRDF